MEGERYIKEVDNFISYLRLGEPDSFGNLTMRWCIWQPLLSKREGLSIF